MREYGHLFLVIASGEQRSRKLLTACQKALKSGDRALIAHRYTTRAECGPYEILLGQDEFAARSEFGCLLLDWQHRDDRYGLGVEVDRWLDGGLNVLALGHNACLDAAKRRYRQYLRVVYAPGGKDPRGWLDRMLNKQRDPPKTNQLRLSLGDSGIWTVPLEGLRLSEDLTLASQQLCGWLREDDPPALAA